MSTDSLSDYTLEKWQAVADKEIKAAETRLFIDGDYHTMPSLSSSSNQLWS